ncbi:MAG: hypothetical protein ACYTFM_12015 [Planctomycetota bacterium]
MKKSLIIVFILALFVSETFAKYSGGTGELNNPYRIATAEDLSHIWTSDWDKNFVAVNDINMVAYTGSQHNIIGSESDPFTGVFDGNGFTISNFTYSSTEDYIGLFGSIGSDGTVKNIAMEDVNIDAGFTTGRWVIGAIAGENKGQIINCCVNGSVIGKEWVGGLVGHNDDTGLIFGSCFKGTLAGYEGPGGISEINVGTIRNCYVDATVWGEDSPGALVDYNGGIIENCYTKGYCYSPSSGASGLVGSNYGAINKCYSMARTEGFGDYVAGLISYNGTDGIVSNSYTTGSVEGHSGSLWSVGGLIAYNKGVVQYCYSVADVNGDTSLLGGLVGRTKGGSYTSCFWDVNVNPDVNGIGNGSDPNVIGLPTTEMMKENTFTDAGWDFSTPVWTIQEGVDYPRLWWKIPVEPVDLIIVLGENIDTLNLQKGIANNLKVKLNTALSLLEDENEHNDVAAFKSLQSFLNAVNAQNGKGISEEDAEYFIAAVQQIIDILDEE